jgi:hypothetical protein
MRLNLLIAEHIFLSTKPERITYKQADAMDMAKPGGGHSRLFKVRKGFWEIDVDWALHNTNDQNQLAPDWHHDKDFVRSVEDAQSLERQIKNSSELTYYEYSLVRTVDRSGICKHTVSITKNEKKCTYTSILESVAIGVVCLLHAGVSEGEIRAAIEDPELSKFIEDSIESRIRKNDERPHCNSD